jgi:hypothetical protein
LIEREGTTLLVSPSQLADRLEAGALDSDLPFVSVAETAEQALH